MCLEIHGFKTKKEAKDFKPSVAKKNITVWKKVVKTNIPGRFEAMYQSFYYERGFHYYQTKEENDSKFGISYEKTYTWWINDSFTWTLKIDKGLHSYTKRLDVGARCSPYKVIKCIIPKGAEYYTSSYGHEIVSDQLIIL